MSHGPNEKRRTKCRECGRRRLVYVVQGMCGECCTRAFRAWLIAEQGVVGRYRP